MHDELAGVRHPARPAELGMARETRGLRAYQLIEGDGRPWVLSRDVFPDGPAIIGRRAGPDELQEARAILRLAFRRHASASASTSSAEIVSPAVAASSPIWTCRRNQAS